MRRRRDPLYFHQRRDRRGIAGREGVLVEVPTMKGNDRQQDDEQGRKENNGPLTGPWGW